MLCHLGVQAFLQAMLVLQLVKQCLGKSVLGYRVSQISIEKMAAVAREYKLGGLARWPKSDEKLHLPLIGFMAISEAILKVGVFLPLHPFIDQVLQFFDIVPFQVTPNSYRIIVAFVIAFFEACGVKPSLGHFTYIFGIKATAKHAGFCL